MYWTFSERSNLHIHNSQFCIVHNSIIWSFLFLSQMLGLCFERIMLLRLKEPDGQLPLHSNQSLYIHRCKYQQRPGWGPGRGIRRGLRSPWASCTVVCLWQQSWDPWLHKTQLLKRIYSVSQNVHWSLYPVCKSDSSPLIKIVKATAWNEAPFVQKMLKHVLIKNGQIDWITYIFRTVSSDQTWVCLHLDILPLPEALSALPSNIHLSPPSWPDTALDWSFSSTKDKTLYFHFQHTTCPRCSLTYQHWLW